MRVKGIRGELYFHVIGRIDRKLYHSDGRTVVPGKELKAGGYNKKTSRGKARRVPVLCGFGMHASKEFSHAASFVFPFCGTWICIVRLWGNVKNKNYKSAGMRRKVVAMRQCDGTIRASESSQTVYNWVMANPWSPE